MSKQPSAELGNGYPEIRKWHTLAILLGLLLLGVVLILGAVLVERWSTAAALALREIGFVFAPVAALGLLYEHFAERRYSKYLAQKLVQSVLAELDRRIGDIDAKRTVAAIYPNRHSINFHEFFKSAAASICILATNLQSMSMYLGLLAEKARGGVSVRVLTLNPTSEFLGKRFIELRMRDRRHFFDEMVASLREFAGSSDGESPTTTRQELALRVYENPPSIMVFRADARLIVGFILRQGRSRDCIHVEFGVPHQPDRSSLAGCFVEHFELLWEEATPVTWELLDRVAEKP